MKRNLMIFLAAAVLMLSSCSQMTGWEFPQTTMVPAVEQLQPDLKDTESIAVRNGSVLYFRYLDEPYLAAETRSITQYAGQSYEFALISALLGGPGSHSASLRQVFQDGVRLLSTVKQGRILFVTLSENIMDPYADEPDNWQADDAWRKEVPLRRQLCMQAITATVTENCDVDRVQILVQQGKSTGSLRLRQNYFMDDSEDDVLVGPMMRDESLLLTPNRTSQVILSCWMNRDWTRLYRYIASTDPDTGAERMAYADFVVMMEILPAITAFDVVGGSISMDGSYATMTMSCNVLQDGQSTPIEGVILHLYREGSLWKISQSDLTAWLTEVAG